MTSTTPTNATSSHHRTRSTSATRKNSFTPSRPTTPLRPSSRSSLRNSAQRASGPYTTSSPLDLLEPDFAELSDAMADLESNLIQLQLMHESLARFSESFAAFLYGMNMNAFCVDFPEQPIPDSFKRAAQNSQDFSSLPGLKGPGDGDIEATFLTTDTSFVENPPLSKATSKFQTPHGPKTPAPSRISRGGGGGGIPRAGRGGGIPTRGGVLRGSRGTRGGSQIGRGGIGRGRGAK